jgi:hypothetical protein
VVRIHSPRPTLIWGLRPQTPYTLTRTIRPMGLRANQSCSVRVAHSLTARSLLIWGLRPQTPYTLSSDSPREQTRLDEFGLLEVLRQQRNDSSGPERFGIDPRLLQFLDPSILSLGPHASLHDSL